jgi:hypothetical protein
VRSRSTVQAGQLLGDGKSRTRTGNLARGAPGAWRKLGIAGEPLLSAVDEGIVVQPGSPDAAFMTFEEEPMPTIVGHHDISKGKDHWLSSPKREELFGPLGVTNIRTFVDPQNPNHVAVVMDVPDLDAFTAAMQTEAAAEAMTHDGVMPETLVILVAE